MNKFMMPGKTKQVQGTILAPVNAGLRLILNLCGENGKFEHKLDKLLITRWSRVKSDFKEWHAMQQNFKLGSINKGSVISSDVWVCAALVRDKNDKLDQKALQTAMKKLCDLAKYEAASVHVSNFLTEEVPELKELLLKELVGNGVNVYFYEEPI